MNTEPMSTNRERQVSVFNGWVTLPIVLLLVVGGLAVFIY